jgi:hypothetical protein
MLVTLGDRILFVFDNMDGLWDSEDSSFDVLFANLTNVPSV